MRTVLTIVRALVASAVLCAAGAAASGCAGCENTVCCQLPDHTLPRVLRPSECTRTGGTSVAPMSCDVVCCQNADGSHTPGSRATCTNVVDPYLCDLPDGG